MPSGDVQHWLLGSDLPAVGSVIFMISILPPDPGHVHVPFTTYTIIIGNGQDVLRPLVLVQTYTDALQGGGGRYPYPKYVWSPAGE